MRKIFLTWSVFITLIFGISSNVLAADRLSLGYIYSASKSHSEIIEFTNNSINVVSPTCLDMKPNGRLDINSMISKEFIDEMHEKNIKVTPFLSNHWGKKRAQAALRNPYPLINDIITVVNEYNLDGINVDLENLDSTDRNALTEFMRLLRNAMPKDKTLSIAVAANPQRLTTTWLAAYNYGALAEYVDYMVVMTYDEHCYGGSEGPVAGINFVEESIKVVLEEVPRDKIVMGIPLYGRFWKEGEDVGGEAIVIANVPRIVKKYRLVPKYNLDEETPLVKLEVSQDEVGPYINGRTLEPGVYNIWYENERSIKAKLALVNKYNLLGTGLWALDNEDADFWTYYKDALNDVPFETIKEEDYRSRLEYAKQYSIKVEPKKIKIPLYTNNENKTLDLEIFKLQEKFEDFKINIRKYDVAFLSERKGKLIRIMKFFINENNEIKSKSEFLYFDIGVVESVNEKALIVV